MPPIKRTIAPIGQAIIGILVAALNPERFIVFAFVEAA